MEEPAAAADRLRLIAGEVKSALRRRGSDATSVPIAAGAAERGASGGWSAVVRFDVQK